MTAKKLGHSADDCLQAFKDLQSKHGVCTRDRYRKESGIPEATWEYHFGTFAELKRQAGAAPTAAARKLTNAVARHTASKSYEPLNRERAGYAESYVREDQSRYKTMLVASDLHDKEMDPFMLRVMVDTAKRVQPDVVCLGGDVFDLPEFGRFTVDPREWDAAGRIKFAHENILGPLREAAPDAQMDLIEGNHECVSVDTEILTKRGWVRADEVTRHDRVASFDILGGHRIRYERPVALAVQEGRELFDVTTAFKHERITENHSVIYDHARVKLEEIDDLDGKRFKNALAVHPLTPIAMPINMVQLAVWIITKGTIRRTAGPDKYWVSFRAPLKVKRRIKGVVQNIEGLNWVDSEKGVELEGPKLAHLLEVITGMEDIPDMTRWNQLPDWFEHLPIEYGQIVAHELQYASTQTLMGTKISYYNGYDHAIGEALQWFLVQRCVPAAMKYLDRNQYILSFSESGELERWRGSKVSKRRIGNYKVISIQTVDGSLITRMNGKINFTGNCRLVKHLADFSPATRSILADLHGMTLGDMFGLTKYQVNYIAKADLKSFTERDHKKELENNYKVYWDSVMVHHFPHARHMGMPGVNGHHHKHVVWSQYNIHCGSYTWHQLGGGHKAKASYCEGERWQNGFALIHVDTLTKTVNIEYVPVTSFAVVGGKYYTREAHEIIT